MAVLDLYFLHQKRHDEKQWACMWLTVCGSKVWCAAWRRVYYTYDQNLPSVVFESETLQLKFAIDQLKLRPVSDMLARLMLNKAYVKLVLKNSHPKLFPFSQPWCPYLSCLPHLPLIIWFSWEAKVLTKLALPYISLLSSWLCPSLSFQWRMLHLWSDTMLQVFIVTVLCL